MNKLKNFYPKSYYYINYPIIVIEIYIPNTPSFILEMMFFIILYLAYIQEHIRIISKGTRGVIVIEVTQIRNIEGFEVVNLNARSSHVDAFEKLNH